MPTTNKRRSGYCNCFRNPGKPPVAVKLSAFEYLHPQGQQLIRGWFNRAWEQRHAEGDDTFEPFIFAWFAVNGWATCVTGKDKDAEFMKRLCSDTELESRFQSSMESSKEFRSHARAFAECWPIFEVKALRNRRHAGDDGSDRQQLVDFYLKSGATAFEPQCWQQHREKGEDVPCDWAHTIAAIYKVRCNLFHGQKAAHSEMDQMIVGCAFRALIHFFHEARLL